ncbi:P-loop containing nucleoside triphosphate hydrolases superfamily protein [Rhynchospora pubera]|uniref:P-loop containing nucleoside triphosphate hydrolases superfamily protein n=2 Tax=Rhynchospora pubera TaxID=906938 RepID=A0AAV8HE82_9POAL|nr:P-loop containing nucleoside triphosphate hydrolases superfamily protein [Rhynchospora pubera]
MYARTLKSKGQNWDLLLTRFRSRLISQHYTYGTNSARVVSALNQRTPRKFTFSPPSWPNQCQLKQYNLRYSRMSHRLYSSKGDGSSASEGKHVPVKDGVNEDKFKGGKEEIQAGRGFANQHARLGEQDQQEWLSGERFFVDSKRTESPFLSKRQKFKNEFLRRVIPWEKINLSLDTFPYYLDETTKSLLMECVASHLKHKDFTSLYGSRLTSSGERILLRSFPGTELYRERLVKAIAYELQVPLLILDSSVLAPFDFGKESLSEAETDDDIEEPPSESDIEDGNDTSNEEEYTSGHEGGSSESEERDSLRRAHAEATKVLKHITSNLGIETPVTGRISGEEESTSASDSPETTEPEAKKPLKIGDRVKYMPKSPPAEADQRIILGNIHTLDGSTTAFTFVSGRKLSHGARGEVFEINGDQVSVIFNLTEDKLEDTNKSEDADEQDEKPSAIWVDIQDLEHDMESQADDLYAAVQALCEMLPSLEPVIVYFPDSSKWLSRAVPKSKSKEFVEKLEEMLDQLTGPIVLICGQNVVESATKEREKYTMMLPQLGRIARLPFPLNRLAEGLKEIKSSKKDNIWKLFTNALFLPVPKEEEHLRTFNNQIEEDRKIIVSRHNLIELHKVLEENELSCLDLLHVKSDGVVLTRPKAEKIAGWAKSNYLSSVSTPITKGDRLIIPRESLDIAIARLREEETISKKPAQNLKSLAKDEYESNFISAVVPPDEIGVKFDDIGALEDVKTTLDELVTLPMRRPELFSHGNLLRPCKGILLFGPPGTGKTLLAKALATEAGANFISITGSTLTSKWFGDAEKLTKALFSFASRLAPVIIFVDEVDSLLGARGGAFEHEATRRMRNEFMAAWDGLRSKDTQRILILAATNRPFDLDDAVIRRLPRRIYVDLPDAQNRMKILRIFLSKENLDPHFNLEELANATEGYSGSDLKNLCIAAAYRPVQELLEEEKKAGGVASERPSIRSLKVEDFIKAKEKVSPSVAYDATSMNELRKWNDQYGEGGSRKHTPFGFVN